MKQWTRDGAQHLPPHGDPDLSHPLSLPLRPLRAEPSEHKGSFGSTSPWAYITTIL